MGTQWKTTGGSVDFLRTRSCEATLTRIEARKKRAKAERPTFHVGVWLKCALYCDPMSWRRPIFEDVREGGRIVQLFQSDHDNCDWVDWSREKWYVNYIVAGAAKVIDNAGPWISTTLNPIGISYDASWNICPLHFFSTFICKASHESCILLYTSPCMHSLSTSCTRYQRRVSTISSKH